MLGTLVSALGGTGDGMAEAGRAGAEGRGDGRERRLTGTRSPPRSSPAGTRTRARAPPTRPPRGLRLWVAAAAGAGGARAGGGPGPGGREGGGRAGTALGGRPARRPCSGRASRCAERRAVPATLSAACPAAGLDARGRLPAGPGAGPRGGRAEDREAPGAAAGLCGPAGGAPGAAVRTAGGRRAQRLPPHAAARAARAGAQCQLPRRGQARRPPLPAAHQPAQRLALGVQDFLRPCSLPKVPA
ncbi:hypothetical protein LEMLEM_LOCUS6167 [Lemmus lemmus]